MLCVKSEQFEKVKYKHSLAKWRIVRMLG